MRKDAKEYTPEQEEDLLWLLRNKYKGDSEEFGAAWGFVPEGDAGDMSVPTIDELKADAYRQLKGCITGTSDPQKIANTIKILEDMKDRDAGKGLEETAKGVSASIESLALDAPPELPEALDVAPVTAEHAKRPRRRRKAIPSKDVNGLDENSDMP